MGGQHPWHRRRDGGNRGSCKPQWWRRVVWNGVSARFGHRRSFSQRRQHWQSLFWKITESTLDLRFVSEWSTFIHVVLLGGVRSAPNTLVVASATEQPCRRLRCFECSKHGKQQRWRLLSATTATATRTRHCWRLLIDTAGGINQGACPTSATDDNWLSWRSVPWGAVRRTATVITRQWAKSWTCFPSPSWAHGPYMKVTQAQRQTQSERWAQHTTFWILFGGRL